MPDRFTFLRHDLFGGRGEVRVVDLMQGVARPPFTAALDCTLAPGGSVGPHRQEHHPELVICLGGRGIATVNGVETDLDDGVLVHLPLGAVLSLRNLSDATPLRYLIVKSATAPRPAAPPPP